jgi:hypothetical protein
MFIYHLSITIRSSLFCKGKQFCGNPQKKIKKNLAAQELPPTQAAPAGNISDRRGFLLSQS